MITIRPIMNIVLGLDRRANDRGRSALSCATSRPGSAVGPGPRSTSARRRQPAWPAAPDLRPESARHARRRAVHHHFRRGRSGCRRPAANPSIQPLRRHRGVDQVAVPSSNNCPRPGGPTTSPEPQPRSTRRTICNIGSLDEQAERPPFMILGDVVHPGLRLLCYQGLHPPGLVRRRSSRRVARPSPPCAWITSWSPVSRGTACNGVRGGFFRRCDPFADPRAAADRRGVPDAGLRQRRRYDVVEAVGHPRPQPRDGAKRLRRPCAEACPLGPDAG